jgi:hypothetical protein
MAQRIANEGEHRRGLVLGLTLAEILLLLLFLLLLALGVRVHNLVHTNAELHGAIADLEPLFAEIRTQGWFSSESVEVLVKRLAHMQQLERQVSALTERNAELETRLAGLQALGFDTTEKLKALEPIIRAASQINPEDPPSVLRRGMAMVKTVGMDIEPDRLKSLSEMASKGETRDKKIAELTAEGDRFRRERDNLMRRGNGLTYPSCWTGADGRTEYIFDVTIRDTGMTVRDIAPSNRATDPALKYIDPFPRNREIDDRLFLSATTKLFNWSKEQNCRFYSVIRDGTGATSKERYKYLRTVVENHFYPLHLSVNADFGEKAARWF